jgi:outer membrane protein OmpA-like peptidoglycan-associated protein
MYAGVSALPENLEFSEDDTDEKKQLLVDSMSEKVQEIMDRTVALQSKNDWECGCVDVNIAASMRGIEFDELQDGVYGRLAEKYSEEVADTGLVVDSFGVLGRHPQEVWGFSPIITRDNILRRQPIIYRGDSLILDPFDPSQEWVEHPIVDFTGLGVHEYTAVEEPTDLVISEYLEGRAAQPPPVANLVKHKIVLDSEVTFDLDKYEVRAEASESLSRVADVINRSQIFSEIEIVGHTCDLASDEYNQVLSERRAQSVKNFLAGAGLNVENVRTMGRGEGEPFVPNDSEENRSKNRRVEITFFTVGDMEINKTVSQADGTTRKVEFEYIRPEDVAAANAAMRAWEEAEASRQDMDDEHRNRAIELYNGTEEVVDLGQGQYFLEIYSPEKDEEVIVAPPLPRLVKNTITLDSEVTFDLDKYDIKVEADESLKAVAKVINNAKIFSEIQIVGHTCDLASDDYNQILSENRARSVKDFLEAAGLDVDHIRTEGRGEAEPRFPNDNEANRSKNRRVEITFLTQEGLEIEKTVTDGDSRKVEISWVRPEGDLGTEGADESLTTWKQRLVPVVFNEEGYIEGTNDPRRVIGLNGAIEPGETFVIAYNESDEAITDVANLVTGQLDFRPNDTILLRKVAGDLAMSCRASSFAYVNNFPAEPPIRPITITPPPPPNNDDFASPH